MRSNTAILAILMMAALLFSLSAQSIVFQPNLYELWNRSTIIALGHVLEVYDMEPIEGINHQCAMIAPETIIKGNITKNTKKICYRNAKMVELGPGPIVKAGEEVIFFGLWDWADEVKLSSPDFGLVSPSNSQWTVPSWKTLLWSSTRDYETFKEAVIRAAAYESATYEAKGQMAEEFIRSDNPHLWEYLHCEVIEKQKSITGSMGYDYKMVAQELMARIHIPSDKFRLRAFYFLQELDKVKEVNGRLKNEIIDSALYLMSDENISVRTSAFRAAKRLTDLNPYDEKTLETINPDREDREKKQHYDFGFDPEAPEQERAVALEKWKVWWKENRGKGRYDASEEKYERIDKWKKNVQKDKKEAEIRQGKQIFKEIQRGDYTLDPSDPVTPTRIKYLKKAGYEVTADGQVIEPSETKLETAVSGNANDSFLKRIGCAMSYNHENEDAPIPMVLAVLLILAFFMLVLRRNE